MDQEHRMKVTSESATDSYGGQGRAWISECSCGWFAGSGLALAWFRTKREAVAAWTIHSKKVDTDVPA